MTSVKLLVSVLMHLERRESTRRGKAVATIPDTTINSNLPISRTAGEV